MPKGAAPKRPKDENVDELLEEQLSAIRAVGSLIEDGT